MMVEDENSLTTEALQECRHDPMDTQAVWSCPLDEVESGRSCSREPTCIELGMIPRPLAKSDTTRTAAPAIARPDRSSPQKSSAPETLCRAGAMALAKRLERYWHERGYPAALFWAEPIDERFEKVGTYELYRVVSNLVGGLPPRLLK